MSIYDQAFKISALYDARAKYPYFRFADTELYASEPISGHDGYLENSLEGLLFDNATYGDPVDTGRITVDSNTFTPDFYYYKAYADMVADNDVYPASITAVSITSNVCTVTCASMPFSVGDVISIIRVQWDNSHPFINGTWVIKAINGNDLSFDINAVNVANYAGLLTGAYAIKGPAFEIRDNRSATDARKQSFTSMMFSPLINVGVGAGLKRVLPSDMYVRFRFQTGSDADPQGGINSNLFNVLDSAGNNIKPILWAYFFGYSSSSLAATASMFQIPFNSYAIVLRPTGDGSRLEFALLKFNWGLIPGTVTGPTSYWMSNIVDTEKFNKYTVSGTELGYLIATNPLTEPPPAGSQPLVTEIAVSDSFTYDSGFAAKFNLKITIRKHLLTDSDLDNTYLVNLMVNDSYDDFGPGQRYDTVLHGYITRPDPVSITTTGNLPHDLQLAPLMYFKFNNTNEQNVGASDFSVSPPIQGSSKIVLDGLFFRQINSSASTPHLY